jgi:hypothetical protein
MSLLLEQDDEFFAMDINPQLMGKQASSPLASLASTLGIGVGIGGGTSTGGGVAATNVTFANEKSSGGVPFGRKGEVTYDVHISVTPNELDEAYASAAYIPLSTENGIITNFQTTVGDSELAENPDIPKIPTKVKIDQVKDNGFTKPLFLECTSFSAVEGEKALELVHSGSKAPLDSASPAPPPFGNLTVAIKENTVADRIQSKALPMAVLGHAHDYGTLPAAIRKTYMQHPKNPLDVIIDVSNPQPYLQDYNNHDDVLKKHYTAVTDDDIRVAQLRNNGIICRKNAFQLIDTLASNSETTTQKFVPYSTESNLRKAQFRVVLGAISRFNAKKQGMAAIVLTFNTLHLGEPNGASFSKAKVEEGNSKTINLSFRITTEFLAFPRGKSE